MDLARLLELLIAGAGGSLLYPLLNRWAWFQALESEPKRWTTIGLSAGIGIIAFVVASVVMQYAPAPTDWRSWVETILSIVLAIAAPGAGAYVVSQGWHARDLR